MKRKIRPAEEEMGNVVFLILFVILWYSSLIGSLLTGGIHTTALLFFVAGLLPVYTAVTMIRKALFYRRQRAEAIAYGSSQLGWIRSVVRQVDITDPATGVVNTITSQGYRKPIHRYLASNQVRVYTDRSGWKHYLEDFQYKEQMKDPGIFDDRPMEFEETTAGSGHVVQILFVVIFILMALTSIFQNF